MVLQTNAKKVEIFTLGTKLKQVEELGTETLIHPDMKDHVAGGGQPDSRAGAAPSGRVPGPRHDGDVEDVWQPAALPGQRAVRAHLWQPADGHHRQPVPWAEHAARVVQLQPHVRDHGGRARGLLKGDTAVALWRRENYSLCSG